MGYIIVLSNGGMNGSTVASSRSVSRRVLSKISTEFKILISIYPQKYIHSSLIHPVHVLHNPNCSNLVDYHI